MDLHESKFKRSASKQKQGRQQTTPRASSQRSPDNKSKPSQKRQTQNPKNDSSPLARQETPKCPIHDQQHSPRRYWRQRQQRSPRAAEAPTTLRPPYRNSAPQRQRPSQDPVPHSRQNWHSRTPYSPQS